MTLPINFNPCTCKWHSSKMSWKCSLIKCRTLCTTNSIVIISSTILWHPCSLIRLSLGHHFSYITCAIQLRHTKTTMMMKTFNVFIQINSLPCSSTCLKDNVLFKFGKIGFAYLLSSCV